jgi:hypothetical protein
LTSAEQAAYGANEDAMQETTLRGRDRIAPPDISEKGGLKGGQPQRSDRRLFMQLQAFGGCRDPRPLAETLAAAGVCGVLYEDVSDPRGIAVLAMSEEPEFFVETLRAVLNDGPFAGLVHKPDYTMFGRTYALGYEPDLEEVLIARPRRTVLNPEWRWAIWYPLRRSGQFERLSAEQQRAILAEHGAIGIAFAPPTMPTTSVWRATGSTVTTTTSSSGSSARPSTRFPPSSSGCGRPSRRRSISSDSGRFSWAAPCGRARSRNR